jgi:hypothetical protein
MFTAVGGAIGLENPSRTLRNQVADYILNHPNEYNQAILGEDPQRYTTKMRRMDTWGGAIELSILSDIYNVEISSIDVKVNLLTAIVLLPLNISTDSPHPVPARGPLRRRKIHPYHHSVLGDTLRPNSILYGPKLSG